MNCLLCAFILTLIHLIKKTICGMQAFSQMRLSEASAHLGSFSARIKEEHINIQTTLVKDGPIGSSLVSVAEKASDAMLMTCPSPYEKRCLLQLLSATDFGDGGSAMSHYRRLYYKISLAEPLLRKDDVLHLGNESLDDASLLTALETNGYWEQARNWAKQLETSGGPWKSAVHHVTETQVFLQFFLFYMYNLLLSKSKSPFYRLNQWWLSGKSFFGMSLKRELLCGATARCFLSDMLFLHYRYLCPVGL